MVLFVCWFYFCSFTLHYAMWVWSRYYILNNFWWHNAILLMQCKYAKHTAIKSVLLMYFLQTWGYFLNAINIGNWKLFINKGIVIYVCIML